MDRYMWISSSGQQGGTNEFPEDNGRITGETDEDVFERISVLPNLGEAESAAATARQEGHDSSVFLVPWSHFLEDLMTSFDDDDDVWRQVGLDAHREDLRVVCPSSGRKTRFTKGEDLLQHLVATHGVPEQLASVIGACCTQAAMALVWTMVMAQAPEGYAPLFSTLGHNNDGPSCLSKTRIRFVSEDPKNRPNLLRPSVYIRRSFVLADPDDDGYGPDDNGLRTEEATARVYIEPLCPRQPVMVSIQWAKFVDPPCSPLGSSASVVESTTACSVSEDGDDVDGERL